MSSTCGMDNDHKVDVKGKCWGNEVWISKLLLQASIIVLGSEPQQRIGTFVLDFTDDR